MIRHLLLAAAVAATLAGCSSAQASPLLNGTPTSQGAEASKRAVASKLAVDASGGSADGTPWEYDIKNPDAQAFVQRVVTCLHRKGVQYAEVDAEPSGDRLTFSLGGPNNDRTSITRGLDLTPQCEREAKPAQPETPTGPTPAQVASSTAAQKTPQPSPVPLTVQQKMKQDADNAPAQDAGTPWEYNVANPKAKAFVQAMVACLHRKGVQYVEPDAKPSGDRLTFSLGGPNNDRTSITRGLDLIPQCEREVAAAQR